MGPELAIVIAQLALRYGPGVAVGVAELFERIANGKPVTAEDWKAVFSKPEKPYEAYVAPKPV